MPRNIYLHNFRTGGSTKTCIKTNFSLITGGLLIGGIKETRKRDVVWKILRQSLLLYAYIPWLFLFSLTRWAVCDIFLFLYLWLKYCNFPTLFLRFWNISLVKRFYLGENSLDEGSLVLISLGRIMMNYNMYILLQYDAEKSGWGKVTWNSKWPPYRVSQKISSVKSVSF